MKKLIALTLGAAMLLSGCGSTSSSSSANDAVEKYGSDTLKLYNWGEYMGENLISNFEEEFGVKVIVEYFDSNEMMYTKLQGGDSYDVLVPSDYMIERLISEDMLQELDLSLIPNISNLAEGVKNLPYDPDNTYSVPYFWGSVGIVYNKNNVDPAVVEEQGWEVLRNTDYAGKVYIYDSERDSFMMAFKALGYSMNTDNEQEIEEAYNWLVELNNTMDPVYVTDEVIDGMINGTKDLAVVYSGDAATILAENEDMAFFCPLTLLFSAVDDKDYTDMIRTILGRIRFRHVVVTQVGGYRKVPAEALAEIFRREGCPSAQAFEDTEAAFRAALALKGEDGMLFCVGSLYLVGEIKELLRKEDAND